MNKQFSINVLEDSNGVIVRINGELPVVLENKNGCFIAKTPILKTFGLSKVSHEEAMVEYKKKLDIFFKVHTKRKSLKTALVCLGWKIEQKTYSFNVTFPNLQTKSYQPVGELPYVLTAKKEHFDVALSN